MVGDRHGRMAAAPYTDLDLGLDGAGAPAVGERQGQPSGRHDAGREGVKGERDCGRMMMEGKVLFSEGCLYDARQKGRQSTTHTHTHTHTHSPRTRTHARTHTLVQQNGCLC